MTATSNAYENPLVHRYASAAMSRLWSSQHRVATWRRMWLMLAETQQELGLPIRDEQLEEMRQHLDDVDFDAAAEYERRLRHDVMAHVRTFGDACPSAKPILHLGATSCFITDNTELLLLRQALQLVRDRLGEVVLALADFAEQHRELPCLGMTHLQPAQPTTVGKRACLWLYDLVLDLHEVDHRLEQLRARSAKGTTGTQASFLKLLDGDHDRVLQLEARITEKMGFDESYPVTGQTYPRKVDTQILDALSGIAQSCHKSATDLRILAHRRELEEPQEAEQVGSSAMAYKRNPMRAERMCSLARFVMHLPPASANTAATQWMERTLDDSALRRILLPQAFLAVDALLILYRNVAAGLQVNEAVVARQLAEELPFMATENILMAAVARGGDRQDLHERIRRHSLAAGEGIREGRPNDLLERLADDPSFAGLDLGSLSESRQFVGRAPEQVSRFLEEVIAPLRQRFADVARHAGDVRV